ncbi:DUF4350 domain-containing protein [Flavobacterium sp. JP2137]|uniref:DUF4350 domain-containing protein n=1 Tax=Flavobacterium sp. JP2137 TaxID=3414510 RepID=UPI003D2FDF08
MNNTLKKYLVFFVFAVALIAVIDYNKPKPINWTPSFDIDAKIPFGLYILNREIDSLIQDRPLHRFHHSVYEFLSDSLLQDSTELKTLLLIEDRTSLNYSDTDMLLDFVAKGHTIFAVGNFFPQQLTDTLNFEEYTYADSNKTTVWTRNQSLSRQPFNLDRAFSNSHFKSVDVTRTTVLGYQTTTSQSQIPNFIRIPYSKGFFYFSTQPKAFTNYSLLRSNNHLYVENLLSYLPKQPTYWKVTQSVREDSEVISSSPLRFILQNPALKWAWYFVLISLVIFVLFTAKRKQRIIPIIKPLTNTTVDFTKTISTLYLQSGDYSDLTDKIILYALSKIRRTYMLDTRDLDERFVHSLHKLTDKDLDKIERWVRLIHAHRANPLAANSQSVIAINTLTEELLN